MTDEPKPKLTVPDLAKKKAAGERLSLVAIADAGVPIMGHVGLIAHQVHRMGGFKTQVRTAAAALESKGGS